MRAVFGVLGLLIVVAIVGLVAKSQLQATSRLGATQGTAGSPAAAPATVPEASRQLQGQVKADVEAALQQGAARASDAQP